MTLVLTNEEVREALMVGLRTKGWRIVEIEKIVDLNADADEDIQELEVHIVVKEPKVVTYDDRPEEG